MPETEPIGVRNESKNHQPPCEPQENQSKPETKAPVQPKNGNNGNGNGSKATGAQCRALYALSRKARMGEEDLETVLGSLNATRFEDLSISEASRLIQYFQTQVAA
jgi:outer membrane biosynthesis protein TonB